LRGLAWAVFQAKFVEDRRRCDWLSPDRLNWLRASLRRRCPGIG